MELNVGRRQKKYVDLSNKEKENYEHLMEKYNSEMGFV